MQITVRNLLAGVFAVTALAACQPKQDAAAPAASGTSASSAPSASAPAAPAANGKLHGTDLRKEDIGGDFTLTDGDGKPFNLSDLKGKVVVLSFGYTNCPDVCPTELLTQNDVLKQLGDQAKDVKVAFVSVDPERDTPEVIGKYAKQFNPDFIGLTATGDQSLPVIKQQYRVVSAKVNQGADSTRRGRIWSIKTAMSPYSNPTAANRPRLPPTSKRCSDFEQAV